MKENFTSINVIIDKSGSMANLTNDTIGGFNKFLSDQKGLQGEAVLTLCTFDHQYHLVHDFVNLSSVSDLDNKTYVPAGSTALLDAIGTTINSVDSKIFAMPEAERPSKVIFLIITDGEENASREYKLEQIRNLITTKQAAGYDFVFMGANIDTIKATSSLGINTNNSFAYTADSRGTHALYASVSDNMSSYRSGKSLGNNFFNKPATNVKSVDLKDLFKQDKIDLSSSAAAPIVNETISVTDSITSTIDPALVVKK